MIPKQVKIPCFFSRKYTDWEKNTDGKYLRSQKFNKDFW